MAACCFFGHRDCPDAIKPRLREVLVQLIERDGVDRFYVGHQGAFDAIVHSVLRELVKSYPQIQYDIVLAYVPQGKANYDTEMTQNTILPEGIETAPKRFAIDRRNKWMLQQSDYVVTYVTHSWGGAAKFANEAKRLGKTVIEI